MTSKTLAVIAAVLIGAGALIGLIPVTSQGANCGSAFVESRDAYVSDLTASMLGRSTGAQSSCTDLRSLIRIPALVLIGGGAVTILAAGVVGSGRRKTTTD